MGWRSTTVQGYPVVVESFDAFTSLFDGTERDGELHWESYLSGAVRDFFRQGGRRAWVVALPPPPSVESEGDAEAALDRLIPRFLPTTPLPSPCERDSWTGIWHLSGLPEVSLLCLPDLPRLLGRPVDPPVTEVFPPLPVPQFLECSPDDPFAQPLRIKRSPSPPWAGFE